MNLLIKEIRHNPLLWLLALLPVVFAAHKVKPEAHTLLFVLSVLAIVPLAALLSHATESVAAKTGDTVGGLLNATLGNLTELVIALAALRTGQYTLVHPAGSIAPYWRNLRSERFAGESPPEGLCRGLVEVGDECLDTLLEFGCGLEITPAQELADQDGKPDFDLIEPGSVFRGEVETDAVSAIAQKRFPCGLALEMSRFPFFAQVFIDAA